MASSASIINMPNSRPSPDADLAAALLGPDDDANAAAAAGADASRAATSSFVLGAGKGAHPPK